MGFVLPQNETERIAALRAYNILDSAPEAAFDDLAQLAAIVCGAPTSKRRKCRASLVFALIRFSIAMNY